MKRTILLSNYPQMKKPQPLESTPDIFIDNLLNRMLVGLEKTNTNFTKGKKVTRLFGLKKSFQQWKIKFVPSRAPLSSTSFHKYLNKNTM